MPLSYTCMCDVFANFAYLYFVCPFQTQRECNCSPGLCRANERYADQLNDLLLHSVPKRIAGFIAEPIQVRRCSAGCEVSSQALPSYPATRLSKLILLFHTTCSGASSFTDCLDWALTLLGGDTHICACFCFCGCFTATLFGQFTAVQSARRI